jgi:hypothetical protein
MATPLTHSSRLEAPYWRSDSGLINRWTIPVRKFPGTGFTNGWDRNDSLNSTTMDGVGVAGRRAAAPIAGKQALTIAGVVGNALARAVEVITHR